MDEKTLADIPEALAFSMAYAVVVLMGVSWVVSDMIRSWREKRKERKDVKGRL